MKSLMMLVLIDQSQENLNGSNNFLLQILQRADAMHQLQ